MKTRIPVIDVFAGCGGLSEGFLQKENRAFFELALALDYDTDAHNTHQLRSFFHQFEPGSVPEEYYSFLRGELTIDELYEAFPREAALAKSTVLQWELGGEAHLDKDLHRKIDDALNGHENWVLIGGPPCQSHSVAGKARNKGKAGYVAAEDKRNFLYKEYLKILHQHRPAVFVMENVKGLLGTKIDGRHIWHLMLEDLSDPSHALGETPQQANGGRKYDGYRIFSLSTRDRGVDIFGVPQLNKDEYVVKCENYGIPQDRHRVLLFGVRADIELEPEQLIRHSVQVPVRKVLSGMTRLRSGLTKDDNGKKIEDTNQNWLKQIRGIPKASWFKTYSGPTELKAEVSRVINKQLKSPRAGRGGNFVKSSSSNKIGYREDWFTDERIGGYCNHETKGHMVSDLHRYMFASCYAKAAGTAIKLKHFPTELLPDHGNVKIDEYGDLANDDFGDRFTVQVAEKTGSTVVRHISKDGHKFIHYDAAQCRSLTVREAARIQTFPDNFYFLGNRTEQYAQVGNAVPPMLSYQIGKIVAHLLKQADLTD